MQDGGTVNLISCILALTLCGRKRDAFGVSARAPISLASAVGAGITEQSRVAAWDLNRGWAFVSVIHS